MYSRALKYLNKLASQKKQVNALKKWAKQKTEQGGFDEVPAVLGGVGSLGLAGYGAAGLNRAKKYKEFGSGDDLVSITGGHLKQPIHPSDTGAGHITPAEELMNILQDMPEVRSGKVNLQSIIQRVDPSGKLVGESKAFNRATGKIEKSEAKKLLKGLTLDSTFGVVGLPHEGAGGFKGWKTLPGYKLNPLGHIGVAADPAASKRKFMQILNIGGAAGGIPSKSLADYATEKNKYITYGPSGKEVHGFNSPEMSPFTSKETMASASAHLKAPLDKKQVLQELINHSLKEGDHKSAAILQDVLHNNKKLLVISGSSRGDYIAPKTIELLKHLRETGREGEFGVLALMANAKSSPLHSLIEGTNAASVGKLDRDLYTKARDIAHGHWSSTGAAGLTEARHSPAPTAFELKSHKYKKIEFEYLKQLLQAERDPAKKAELGKFLDAHTAVDLDAWNNEHKKWLNSGVDHGLKGVDNAAEFLAHADHMALPENKTMINSRVARNLENSVKAKQNLMEYVREELKRMPGVLERAIKNNKRVGYAGLGLGALGLAGAGHSYMKHRHEKQQLTQQ